MADYIFEHGLIVTMDKEGRIIEDGAVVVEGNRILAVGKTHDIKKNYHAEERINVEGKVVMPGLVTTHNHMYNSLTRYMKIPVPHEIYVNFGERLTRWWWPKIEDTCTKDDVYIGTLLAAAEMLKRGITCTADLQEGQNIIPGALDYSAKAVEEIGIRACLSFEATDRVSYEKGQLGLRENEEFVKKWNYKKDSRIRGMIGVHTAFSCHPETLMKAREMADRHKCGIQIHIAQSTYEVKVIREKYGVDGSVEFLDKIGFLGPDVNAAHGIYISKKEIEIWKRNNVGLSFNVKSNTLGANGLPPVVELLKAGCKVGLGIDGVNIFDMFELMLLAAAVVRVYYLDRSLLSAKELLEMATIGGAKVLLLENEVGSLEPGKKADIIVINFSKAPHLTPIFNELDALAFSVRGTDVETVMVDGRLVVQDKKLLTMDEQKIVDEAKEAAIKYQERAIAAPIQPPWSLPPKNESCGI